ncbi:MAG TPA: transporter substrate-binding domain-containing protein [Oligoflexus sp.]|uniref:substrate-binding periplasmic protein n=1 Tax=Oligoflexus sp. TaxID=1971216 RepID=UPI002D6A9BAD|nr:transporter substrate-binding domain-containing protein [Oligoflexus sp.]HYX32537.1 transporter substrate-binding domain-containing protein [Oligoflexus sp.]
MNLERAKICTAVVFSWSFILPLAPCNASEVAIVAIDGSAPPYIAENATGWTLDIIQSALATQDVTAKFVRIIHARVLNAFNSGEVEMVTAAKPNGKWKGFLSSWPVVRFYNVAISLKHKVPKISSIADLAEYRIVAFNDASKYLGPEFEKMAAGNARYKEFSSYLPSRMLFADRTDVIISEANIFRYWLVRQSKDAAKEEPLVAYHDILGPGNFYWFAFKSDALRIKFERGIEEIYRNGTFEKIYQKYHQLYRLDRSMYQPIDCKFLKKSRPKDCL